MTRYEVLSLVADWERDGKTSLEAMGRSLLAGSDADTCPTGLVMTARWTPADRSYAVDREKIIRHTDRSI
jgi:hypothetical protein